MDCARSVRQPRGAALPRAGRGQEGEEVPWACPFLWQLDCRGASRKVRAPVRLSFWQAARQPLLRDRPHPRLREGFGLKVVARAVLAVLEAAAAPTIWMG